MTAPNNEFICRRIQYSIEDNLDSGSVSEHIHQCVECKAFLHTHLSAEAAIDDLWMVTAPAGFCDQVMARVAEIPVDFHKPSKILGFSLPPVRQAIVAAGVLLVTIGGVLQVYNHPSTLAPPIATSLPTASSVETMQGIETVAWMDNDSTSTLKEVVGF